MSEHLYAIHDPGAWFGLVRDAGRTAWCIYTEEIGSDPNNRDGKDFRVPGITPVVRINHAYGKGHGTIPPPSRHAEYVRRFVNYVTASQGLDLVIVGNEIGLEWEWWGDGPITLREYCALYRLLYWEVKKAAPHVRLAPQAVAPWNDRVPDARDWIEQITLMLVVLGNMVDWIGLHTYTRGYEPNAFTSGAKMGPPYQHRYASWETFYEQMAAIPISHRHLPVIITEANGNGPWPQGETRWLSEFYHRVNQWNQDPDSQKVLGAAPFRWQPDDHHWDFSNRPGVIADFRRALDHDYRHGFIANTPASKYPRQAVVEAPAGLNFRVAPNGEIITRLANNTVVTVTGREGDWYSVTVDGREGFVYSAYVG